MKKKILVFDDDVEILSILGYIIDDNGWQLYSQLNCNNILEKVRQISPDVILMDNWIPESGGVVATQTLKQDSNLKNIPVVYFSANNEIARLAREAGADAFLAKPFEIEDLEAMISAFLQKTPPEGKFSAF